MQKCRSSFWRDFQARKTATANRTEPQFSSNVRIGDNTVGTSITLPKERFPAAVAGRWVSVLPSKRLAGASLFAQVVEHASRRGALVFDSCVQNNLHISTVHID